MTEDCLTDRERRVVAFALRRFMREAYNLANAAAQDKAGRWFKAQDAAKFIADAKDAEIALTKLTGET